MDVLGCGAGRFVSLSGGGLTSDLPLLVVLISPLLKNVLFLWFCAGCLFADHAFVVCQVFPSSFGVGESVAFALDGLGHPPPRRGELLEYNL